MATALEQITSTVPRIPRTQWPAHPNYPRQVLLLGSHENFRHLSQHLVESARNGRALEYVGALYSRWIAGMRSHEGYEEHKLYPYLAHRWGVNFDEARAGHEALHQRDRDIRKILITANNDDLADALEVHDRALREHLDLEEELVIPLLLELSPFEFQEYTQRSLGELIGPHDQRASS